MATHRILIQFASTVALGLVYEFFDKTFSGEQFRDTLLFPKLCHHTTFIIVIYSFIISGRFWRPFL